MSDITNTKLDQNENVALELSNINGVAKLSVNPGDSRGRGSSNPPVRSYDLTIEKLEDGSYTEIQGSPITGITDISERVWVTGDIGIALRVTITNTGGTGYVTASLSKLSGKKALKALNTYEIIGTSINTADINHLSTPDSYTDPGGTVHTGTIGGGGGDTTGLVGERGFPLYTFDSDTTLPGLFFAPVNIVFNNDGSKLFATGLTMSGAEIRSYNLPTPYDPSSASSVNNTLSIPVSQAPGLQIKDEGSELYFLSSAPAVLQYTMTTPYDISTASSTGSFNISSNIAIGVGLSINNSGDKALIMDSDDNTINEYDLTTDFDITSLSFVQSADLSSELTSPTGIYVSSDGTRLYITDTNSSVYSVFTYSLSSAYDVSTIEFYSSLNASNNLDDILDVHFTPGVGTMFILDGTNFDINKYLPGSTTEFSSNLTGDYGDPVNVGSVSFNAGGGIQLGDTGNNPSSNGELQNNSGDIIAQSGGTDINFTNVPQEPLTPAQIPSQQIDMYSGMTQFENIGGYYGEFYPAASVPAFHRDGTISGKGTSLTSDQFAPQSQGGGSSKDTEGLVVDPGTGNIIWLNLQENLILVIDRSNPDGSPIDNISPPSPNTPNAITMDPTDGTYWIGDGGDNIIYNIARDGTVITQFNGSFNHITADPADGTLWVINSSTDTIQNLARDGTLINDIGDPFEGGDPGDNSFGITLDPADGTLWVGNTNPDGPDGEGSVAHIDRQANILEEFHHPGDNIAHVAVDPIDGSLWLGEDTGSSFYHINRYDNAQVASVTDRGLSYIIGYRDNISNPKPPQLRRTFDDGTVTATGGASPAVDTTITNVANVRQTSRFDLIVYVDSDPSFDANYGIQRPPSWTQEWDDTNSEVDIDLTVNWEIDPGAGNDVTLRWEVIPP